MKPTSLTVSALLLSASFSNCTNTNKEKQIQQVKIVDNYVPKYDTLAAHLVKTGYSNMFLYMDQNYADTFWFKGYNKSALMEIVQHRHYDDYARMLASEILFYKQKDYPPKGLEDTLGYIYARALFITGDTVHRYRLFGNQWGLMYYDDDNVSDYGILGVHLMVAGKAAVPYLKELLNDNSILVYEGSKEATVGNGLHCRVKDAAAFYIGKIMNIPVDFHDEISEGDKDKEIEKLKKALE